MGIYVSKQEDLYAFKASINTVLLSNDRVFNDYETKREGRT